MWHQDRNGVHTFAILIATNIQKHDILATYNMQEEFLKENLYL